MTTEITNPQRTEPTPPGGSTGIRRARRWRVFAGGIAAAAVLLGLAAVMGSNADFARANVTEQLSEQHISFPSVSQLTPEERTSACLVKYAGQPLTTGKQAECYANKFIGRHLLLVAGGKTYAELRGVQTSLQSQIAEAQAGNDPSAADLQRELAGVNGKRQALFEGESVRGLLMTSYGFATLGTKAEQARTAASAGGAAVLVVSVLALAWKARASR